MSLFVQVYNGLNSSLPGSMSAVLVSRFLIALQEANKKSISPGADGTPYSSEKTYGGEDSLVFARIMGSVAASLNHGETIFSSSREDDEHSSRTGVAVFNGDIEMSALREEGPLQEGGGIVEESRA